MAYERPNPYPLRLSSDLRKQLEKNAECNGVNLSEEIINRLTSSLSEKMTNEQIKNELKAIQAKLDLLNNSLSL